MTAGYIGLFAWSFAAATILPLSSEAALAYLVHEREVIALPVAVATAGNYFGACTTYWMVRGAASAVERRRATASATRRQQRAIVLLRRWGAPMLVLSWVPFLGDALVAAAGALRISFAWSSVWLVTGKLARYAVVAWAASHL